MTAPQPSAYDRCPHGRVRSWCGTSETPAPLPAIERCPVCDANSTPLNNERVDP